MRWFRAITSDLANVPGCIEFFESELVKSKTYLTLKGKTLEKHAAELPGIVEEFFGQLQELESILEHLNLLLKREKAKAFKKFFEGYNKALTSREAEKYAEGDESVYNMSLIVNEVALLRNKYLGLSKGLDTKNWMISNIVKLRCAGLDDVKVD